MPALPIASEDVRVGPALAADNARGNDFSTAIGQGLEHLGAEGSRLAADANRIQYMQAKSDATARGAITASNAHLQLSQYAEQLKSQVPNDGGDYTGLLLNKIDEVQQKAIADEPNPFGKKILAEHFSNIRTSLGEQALGWQSATQRSNRIQNLTDSINQNAQLQEADPSHYQESLKTMTDTINQLDSTLHPTDRTALVAKARQAYMEGASRGFIRSDPQTALQLLTGATPQPPNSIPDKIKQASLDAGVDPKTTLAISYFETGGKFDPNAQNPKSTAHGLFQQLDNTAAQYMAPGADRNDPDAQVASGVKQVADYQRKLTTMLGRTPSQTEVYAAHLLGPGGAAQLARADPNQPMIDLVSKYDPKNAAATVADNGFTGKTVGQVRTQINQWMTGAMQKTAGLASAPATPDEAQAKVQSLPPFFADATPQERDAFIAHAQALVNKKDSDAKIEIEGQMKDFKANMAIGNDAPMPAMNALVAAYGKKGVAMYQDLQQWQQYGHDYGSMKTGTLDQNQALLDARKPPPGAPAEQIMRYEGLKRVFDDINTQRLQQPLETAAASGAYQLKPIDFSDPSTLADQIKARTLVAGKVASDYGTAPVVFNHQETQQLASAIQNAPTSQIASLLKGIKQGSPDARTYLTAMSQIAGDHTVPAVAGAIMEKQNPIQMSPGGMFSQPTSQSQEDVASTMLDGWRAMNPVKGAKETEGKAMRLPLPKNNELETEFATQVGNVFGTDAKSYSAAFDAAKAYYVGTAMKSNLLGEDWSNDKKTLFDKGITAATGGIVDFNGRGKVSPPWGMPASNFNDAMAKAIPAAVAAAGNDPADFPAGRQQLAQIGDGRYALVAGTGFAVGKNKQPIVIDLNVAPAQPSTPPVPPTNRGKKTDVDTDRMIR